MDVRRHLLRWHPTQHPGQRRARLCGLPLQRSAPLWNIARHGSFFPCARKDLHPTRQSGQRGERPAIQESAPRCSIGRLRYRDRVQGLLATAAKPSFVPSLTCNSRSGIRCCVWGSGNETILNCARGTARLNEYGNWNNFMFCLTIIAAEE